MRFCVSVAIICQLVALVKCYFVSLLQNVIDALGFLNYNRGQKGGDTVNERIKKLRKALNLTQQEFADRIGIKRGAIANYEIGRNEPADSVCSLICREFNVNEEWLRSGSGEMFVPEPSDALDELAAEYHLSRGAMVAIEKFVKLSPETQKEILGYFIEVANALQEAPAEIPARPEANLSNLSIEERVELYRRELEREEKGEAESEASCGSA